MKTGDNTFELKTSGRTSFWARLGVRKNITNRKQTEKLKLKMVTMAPKYVPIIYLGLISLDSEFSSVAFQQLRYG